jgi:signal transduction histidine kinase
MQTDLEADPKGLEGQVFELLGEERPLAYALIAPNLCLVQASKRFVEFLSAPQESITDQPLSNLLWEFAGAEEALEQLLSGERPAFRLERINRESKRGEIQYLNFIVVAADRQRPGSGLLLVIEDVTHACLLEQQILQDRNELGIAQGRLERANQELNRLSRLKSLFMAIAAHDLRSPLSAIRAYAELLLIELHAESPEEHREFLLDVCDQVERLDLLITDFLELDLIEQGKLSIQLLPCDLNEVAHEVAERMQRPAQNKGLTLVLNLSEEPGLVKADPDRLRQILYNLVSNALKFTPQGGRVEITSSFDPHSGIVQVVDTGPGISTDGLEHLFELYYRSEEARHSQARGSGLGLFIVKTLVDAQNGQISAASERGSGTTFTIRLPKVTR